MINFCRFRFIIYTIISIILASCGTGEYPKKITENYVIDYDGNGNVHLINTNNIIIIEGDIVEYYEKECFFIFKQKPIKKILDSIEQRKDESYRLKDKKDILKKSKTFDFWILRKDDNSLIGPLKKEELVMYQN